MTDFEPNRSRLSADVCEHLCTKTMFIGQDDRDLLDPDAVPGSGTAVFWCVFTQFPIGADGHEVTPEGCRPGRACCVPRFSLKHPSA